jgi:peptidoglycan hydrolase-like protein with peptidoglycan-binding domain
MRSRRRAAGLLTLALTLFLVGSENRTAFASDYRPLPVGTKLVYDNFTCTIASASGIESVCTVGGGLRINLIGQLVNHGPVPQTGYFVVLNQLGSVDVKSVTVGGDDRARLAGLWPLAVGKSVEYESSMQVSVDRGTYNGQILNSAAAIKSTVQITGTESVTVGGEAHDTLVIVEKTNGFSIQGLGVQAFERTWWVDPALGVVVKARMEWTRGRGAGTAKQSTLRSIQWPAGQAPQAIAKAAPAQPTAPAAKTQTATAAAPAAPATTAAPPAPPSPEELAAAAEPKLTAAQRRALQQQLTTLGFYKRSIDGDLGPGTRKAIRAYQAANEFDQTGYVTSDQLAAIDQQAAKANEAAAASKAAADAAAAAEAQQAEEAERLAGQKAEDQKAEEQRLADMRAEMEQQKAELQRLTGELEAAKQKAAEEQVTAAQLAAEREAVEQQKAELERQQAALAEAEKAAADEAAKAAAAEKAANAAAATEAAKAAAAEEAAKTAAAAAPPAAAAPAAPEMTANLEPIDDTFVAIRPAKVRERPDVSAPVIASLAVGEKIAVLGKLPGQNWYLVGKDDKPLGYVVALHLQSESEAAAASAARTAEATPATEPAKPAKPALPPEIADLDFGRYHALVIGNDEYRSLNPLETAVADATAMAKLLRDEYGFDVKLLTNADRDEIVAALDDLRDRLTWDDNLLIYYAGHGHLDETVERGYWLPVDATVESRARWLSNADITDSLKAINAKSVLVIADSCYSGTLTRGNAIPDRTGDYLRRIASKRARVVMTSGGNEPVADGSGHSPFASALMDALKANSGVLDGTELFTQIRRPVVLSSPQTPEYSDLRFAGHDGGDFIFVKQ